MKTITEYRIIKAYRNGMTPDRIASEVFPDAIAKARRDLAHDYIGRSDEISALYEYGAISYAEYNARFADLDAWHDSRLDAIRMASVKLVLVTLAKHGINAVGRL